MCVMLSFLSYYFAFSGLFHFHIIFPYPVNVQEYPHDSITGLPYPGFSPYPNKSSIRKSGFVLAIIIKSIN